MELFPHLRQFSLATALEGIDLPHPSQVDRLGHKAVGEREEHVFGYAKGAQIVDPDPGQFTLVAGGRIVVGFKDEQKKQLAGG